MNSIRIYWVVAVLFLVAPIGLCAVADEKPAQAAKTKQAPSDAEIGAWIAQLNDNRYLVREQATRNLQDAGAAALDQLQAAADADFPEPADRSIWILRRMSITKDGSLKRPALEHLANLKKRPQVAAAARETLETLKHQEAVAAIEQLGGNYVENQFMVQPGVMQRNGRLDLDSRWHGGDAGLVHMRNLNGMQIVRVVGTDISGDTLINELPHCKTLQVVWLYGTKVTPDEAAKLRKLLPPNVELDYRRGALLGVGRTPGTDRIGPATVNSVSPGSAAAVAGIQVGDVIQKFNGEPLANFKALTQKIGDHQPGDEVALSVLRNGKAMDFKVKLGQWKNLEE